MSANGDRRPGVRQRRRLHGRCRALVGPGGRRARTARSWRSAPTTTCVPLSRLGHRGGRPRRRDAAARVPGRARPSGRGRRRHDPVRPERVGSRRPSTSRRSRRTRPRTPSEPWILGGGWSQDAFPRGCPSKEAARRRRGGPAGLLAEPRRPQRVGELQGARDRAGSPPPRPIRTDGRIERNARRLAAGHAARRGAAPREPACSAGSRRRADVRGTPAKGRSTCIALGITGWQDAIVDRAASHRQPGCLPDGCRAAATLTGARRRRSVVGSQTRHRADRRSRRAPRRGGRGPVRRDERQDHAGRRLRELHGRDARSVSRRAWASDGQPGHLVRRAGAAARRW